MASFSAEYFTMKRDSPTLYDLFQAICRTRSGIDRNPAVGWQ